MRPVNLNIEVRLIQNLNLQIWEFLWVFINPKIYIHIIVVQCNISSFLKSKLRMQKALVNPKSEGHSGI